MPGQIKHADFFLKMSMTEGIKSLCIPIVSDKVHPRNKRKIIPVDKYGNVNGIMPRPMDAIFADA